MLQDPTVDLPLLRDLAMFLRLTRDLVVNLPTSLLQDLREDLQSLQEPEGELQDLVMDPPPRLRQSIEAEFPLLQDLPMNLRLPRASPWGR